MSMSRTCQVCDSLTQAALVAVYVGGNTPACPKQTYLREVNRSDPID